MNTHLLYCINNSYLFSAYAAHYSPVHGTGRFGAAEKEEQNAKIQDCGKSTQSLTISITRKVFWDDQSLLKTSAAPYPRSKMYTRRRSRDRTKILLALLTHSLRCP